MMTSKIIAVFVTIILPLIILFFDRKWNKEKKENMLISVAPEERKYKSVLKIEQQGDAEGTTVIGYSNTYHDILSFIEYCDQIENTDAGITILKENSKIFIPTSSIKQITLTTEMRKLENQPVSQFGTQEKGDI